LDIFLKR